MVYSKYLGNTDKILERIVKELPDLFQFYYDLQTIGIRMVFMKVLKKYLRKL